MIYQDGREIHKEALLGGVPVTGIPMHFGNRMPWMNFGKEQRFNGILDEIAFWTRPLSGQEVKEVMETGMKTILALSAKGKLSTTWASVKAGF